MTDNIKKKLEDYICRIDKAIKNNEASIKIYKANVKQEEGKNKHLIRIKEDMQKLLDKLNEDKL